MLRLWRDRLFISIAPDRISLVRTHGWLRPQVVAKTTESVANAGQTNHWQAALSTLMQILQRDPQWQVLQINVVLSNHFVRYLLIPWSEVISNAEERAAYVRQSFVQIYGEHAADWQFRISDNQHGAAWFASAVDPVLLVQLEQAAANTGSQLHSVTPHLMPAYNQARRAIQAKDVWFVQVEKQTLLLLLITNGHWRAISSHHVDPARWATQLPGLLDREWSLQGAGTQPRKVVIADTDMKNRQTIQLAGWEFSQHQPALRFGLSAQTDHAYAMALGA